MNPFRSATVSEPHRAEHIFAALVDGEEGDLGAVIMATDPPTEGTVLLDAQYGHSLGDLDGFAAVLVERVVELGRHYRPSSGDPGMIYCPADHRRHLERHERMPAPLGAGAASPWEWVGVISYPDFIEGDPLVRAKSAAAAWATGRLRFAPECAERALHHPIDSLKAQRFGPGGGVLPLALGLALELVRDPAPRRRVRARKNPHSAGFGQSAAR